MKKIIMKYFIIGIIFLCCIITSCAKSKMQKFGIDINIIPIGVTSDENNIYMIADEYDIDGELVSPQLYSINKDSFEFFKFSNFDFSETLKPVSIALGSDNSIYTVVRKNSGELQYEIWKMSTLGIVEEKYDISKCINENEREGIKSFIIDNTGSFYIRERVTDEIIVLNNNGMEMKRIKDKSNDMSFESMSSDESGNVFALFCMNLSVGGGYTLYTYNNGETVNESYSERLLPYNEMYSVMNYNKNNCLMFKGLFSVYNYSLANQKTEKIIDLSLDKYSYTKSCFDREGNLFIFAVYKLKDFENTGNVELLKYSSLIDN